MHGYRSLQHWDKWLSQQFLGAQLLEAEVKQFFLLLEKHYGKHAGLIGVPHQHNLLTATKIPCHSLITPLLCKENKYNCIEGDLYDLPILTGSMDLIMLPHTLEFMDNPRQLLAEACRIIKPEGLIVISGFNTLSSWGFKKIFTNKNNNFLSGANFIPYRKIISWLKLVDFAIEKRESTLFAPPVKPQLYKKLNFLEKLGSKWFPLLGGVYIIVARAKVIPLTPIRLKWKQQLGNIRISTTIPGNIARCDES